jgi:hypothetical protein
MLNNILAILMFLQVPGTESPIPGIPKDYITPDAGKLVQEIYDKIFADALIIAVYLIAVTLGMYLIDKVYKNQLTFSMVVVNVVGTALLLAAIPQVFKHTLEFGTGIASDIMTADEIVALNKQYSDAAKAQEQAKENKLVETGTQGTFLSVINLLAGLALGVSIWSGVYSLIAIIYALSIQVIMLLWKTFALILYLFAPICVCLGVIPGFGTRIVASWYGALVQLSAWQIWIALCTRFIKEADILFLQSITKGLTGFDPREQFNAVAIALLFIVLNLAGPIMISLLFPTSRFVGAATNAVTSIANSGVQTAKNVAGTATKAIAAAV